MLIFAFSLIAFMVGLFVAVCVARIVFAYVVLVSRILAFLVRGTYRLVRFVVLAPVHVAGDMVRLIAWGLRRAAQ